MRALPAFLFVLCTAAGACAEDVVDQLLGGDPAAYHEAACRIAHEGKDGLARLEARLAKMKPTAEQEGRAATTLSLALLFTTPRADLAAWPVLAGVAKERIAQGRELAKRLAGYEGKFRSPGNGAPGAPEPEPAPLDLDDSALRRLQGFALEGIADLCASEEAINRAYGASLLIDMNAFQEQAALDRLSNDGGGFHTFDGCCDHATTVGETVKESLASRSSWIARRAAKPDPVFAAEVELMVQSLQQQEDGGFDGMSHLVNGLRQAVGKRAPATSDAWWDAARPVWRVWWNEFAGKPMADGTTKAWWKRVEEVGGIK
ncbi:MAG: hypothetical protein HYY18_15200 [Planctomycetes bacterium]|nr:hypothetical protein [Planctomycetota bacterium]